MTLSSGIQDNQQDCGHQPSAIGRSLDRGVQSQSLTAKPPMAKGLFLQRFIVLAAIVLAACSTSSPLVWGPAVNSAGDALPGRLALESGGPTFRTDTAKLIPPSLAGSCAGSARVALAGTSGRERYVAWWSPRPDSSAELLAARSVDGGQSWSAPEQVDTADHTPVGCKRPAPAIAADSASGYVHVAYGMRDAQGAGVFFSHSMERGRMFHSPVTILYGERLASVAIAAHGDTVAIAYVDPSSDHPPLGLTDVFHATITETTSMTMAVPSARLPIAERPHCQARAIETASPIVTNGEAIA